MQTFITLQAGNLAQLAANQPDEIYIGPVHSVDLDHGTLTVYDGDIDFNWPIAHISEAMYENGAMVPVWEVRQENFSNLDPYNGMVWSRALVHLGNIPAFGSPVLELFPERADVSRGTNEYALDRAQCKGVVDMLTRKFATDYFTDAELEALLIELDPDGAIQREIKSDEGGKW